MPWQNFSIWRGRLPHWRADGVQYYVTFRHRRPLTSEERLMLFRCLLKPEGSLCDLLILCVLPEVTEMILTVRETSKGTPTELAQIVEKAKLKAGKLIIKKSEERFPPFYTESYDRIIRDENELEERWQVILDSPIQAEISESADEYDTIWVKDAPE